MCERVCVVYLRVWPIWNIPPFLDETVGCKGQIRKRASHIHVLTLSKNVDGSLAQLENQLEKSLTICMGGITPLSYVNPEHGAFRSKL